MLRAALPLWPQRGGLLSAATHTRARVDAPHRCRAACDRRRLPPLARDGEHGHCANLRHAARNRAARRASAQWRYSARCAGREQVEPSNVTIFIFTSHGKSFPHASEVRGPPSYRREPSGPWLTKPENVLPAGGGWVVLALLPTVVRLLVPTSRLSGRCQSQMLAVSLVRRTRPRPLYSAPSCCHRAPPPHLRPPPLCPST